MLVELVLKPRTDDIAQSKDRFIRNPVNGSQSVLAAGNDTGIEQNTEML